MALKGLGERSCLCLCCSCHYHSQHCCLGLSKQREMLLKGWGFGLCSFNSHKHYLMGCQTETRFCQFCLLGVLCDSSLAWAFAPKMSSPTNKICWYCLTQRIQSRHRSLRKLSQLLIRLTLLWSSLFSLSSTRKPSKKTSAFVIQWEWLHSLLQRAHYFCCFGTWLNIKTCGSLSCLFLNAPVVSVSI